MLILLVIFINFKPIFICKKRFYNKNYRLLILFIEAIKFKLIYL